MTFSDGRRAFISAKRRVSTGRPFVETVAGWVAQSATLEADDLLVLAGEDFTGPAKDLDRVLRRLAAGLAIETQAEQDAFELLYARIPAAARERVLKQGAGEGR
ncbi:hypothetical protein O1R50_26050 [Glycomyces luteolus]|uniref:Uncharacterized protein n=1 Tax=Glycomyces luteolus TaxID=2670330 RepID=A0A9X3SVY7_9ACTN|nr:hypothetical protein [Glycomyces luteolus]MDA1363103.1 hypothetical protein [Glycomyces luteolus]